MNPFVLFTWPLLVRIRWAGFGVTVKNSTLCVLSISLTITPDERAFSFPPIDVRLGYGKVPPVGETPILDTTFAGVLVHLTYWWTDAQWTRLPKSATTERCSVANVARFRDLANFNLG